MAGWQRLSVLQLSVTKLTLHRNTDPVHFRLLKAFCIMAVSFSVSPLATDQLIS